MSDDEPKTYRCRAGTEGQRCSFHGTRDELADHADEMGHPRCIVPKGRDDNGERRVCSVALAWHEIQCCDRCVIKVRDDLDAVAAAFAHLERVISQGAYRGVVWDALTLAADGSLASPQRPDQYTRPIDLAPTVHVEHVEIVGDAVTHLAFIEERLPSDGREHVVDHWPADPMSVLAVLEHNERDWRHEFGHGPAVDMATMAGCLGYLRKWHPLAARTHPGFDDYAETIRDLRSKLEHVVGFADDPVRAPAQCFDCRGQLVRSFAPPTATTEIPEHDCALCGTRHAGRHGGNSEGLTDDWTCRGCGRVYDQASYFLALRAAKDSCQGWVPIRLAATVLRIPSSTLFRWASRGEVETVRENGRTFVEWSEVSVLREERAS